MPRQTLISLLHLGEESRSPHPSRNHFVVRRRLPPPLCLIRFIDLLPCSRACMSPQPGAWNEHFLRGALATAYR